MSKTIHCKNGLELIENRYGYVRILEKDSIFHHHGVWKETLKGMTCAEIKVHCIVMRSTIDALNAIHISDASPVRVGYIGSLESWGDDRGWYVEFGGKRVYSGVPTWDIKKLWDKLMDYIEKDVLTDVQERTNLYEKSSKIA